MRRFMVLLEDEAVEPDRKKYLTPILAVLLLLLAFVVIPLFVAETSRKHVRKIDPISSSTPTSRYNADIMRVTTRLT
jgi:hypothetical protein